MLTSLTRSDSSVFDLIVMAKDGTEQSGLKGKREQFRSLSLNSYAIIIDKNRREGGIERQK